MAVLFTQDRFGMAVQLEATHAQVLTRLDLGQVCSYTTGQGETERQSIGLARGHLRTTEHM